MMGMYLVNRNSQLGEQRVGRGGRLFGVSGVPQGVETTGPRGDPPFQCKSDDPGSAQNSYRNNGCK